MFYISGFCGYWCDEHNTGEINFYKYFIRTTSLEFMMNLATTKIYECHDFLFCICYLTLVINYKVHCN